MALNRITLCPKCRRAIKPKDIVLERFAPEAYHVIPGELTDFTREVEFCGPMHPVTLQLVTS